MGGLQVTGTNQGVGIVSGTGTTNGDGATIYNGDTVVGPGASLTATQILQNSLTIGAGGTVTIAPSGSGFAIGDTSIVADVAPATDNSDVAGGSIADSADPLMAIQAAIASGTISSVTGQHLENRLAAIERLAAMEPGLDVSFLESRVLSAIPSSSVWSSTGSSPLGESGAGLLAIDTSDFASASGSALGGATAALSSTGGFSSSIAIVPEPSSLLLAGLGSLGLAALGLKRRRTNHRLQGT
jgi:hypothetical protein